MDRDVSDPGVQRVSRYSIRITPADHSLVDSPIWTTAAMPEGRGISAKKKWRGNRIRNARSVTTARHVALTVARGLGSGIVDRVTTPALWRGVKDTLSRGLGGPRTLRELEASKVEVVGVTVINASLDGHSGAGGQALVGKNASECVINPAVSVVPSARKPGSQRWRSVGVHWRVWIWIRIRICCECRGVVVHVELERK